MAKGCALSTGYLPQGGLPWNSVDRITNRPDMTSAVDSGRKASTQTKKTNICIENKFFTPKMAFYKSLKTDYLDIYSELNNHLLVTF